MYDLFGSSFDENRNCETDICQRNQDEAIRRLIALRDSSYTGMSFGSFLTQFIHLNKFNPDTFGSCQRKGRYTCGNFISCKKLRRSSRMQAKIHDYLTHLSIFYGFSESELVSLYELPGMLAHNIDYNSDMSKGIYGDNLLGDTPQAFLYSTCKAINKNVFTYKKFIHDCSRCDPWTKKLNETGTYST